MSEYENIPDELKARDQWLLFDTDNDTPRQPHWRGDFEGISWSDPDDWHSFEEACEAAAERDSWGIGYVTAVDNPDYARGLYGVIDLDGCADSDGSPKDWVPGIKPFVDRDAYIEWSPSGTGLHIPVWNIDTPDWWSNVQIDDHEGVDVLTNSFCTFTGDCENASGEDAVDMGDWLIEWLADAYENIKGETAPPRQSKAFGDYSSGQTPDEDYDGDDLTEEQVEEALDHVDSSLHYNDWLRVGFAVYDWDSGARGRRLFESWSRSNGKWDAEKGQSHIDDIWANDSANGSVGVGTLVHHAQQGGWSFGGGSSGSSGEIAGDGGVSAATPTDSNTEDHTPDSPTWDRVKSLFAAEENGTTTSAYSAAADILCRDHDFITIRKSGEMYYYDPDGGYYVRKGETFVAELLREYISGYVNSSRSRNIREAVEERNFIGLNEFTPPENKVNVRNGVINLDAIETDENGELDVRREDVLEPHSPEYYFTAALDVDFDPTASGGIWNEQVERAIDDAGERQKLEEFIGYCLEQWHHDRSKNMFFVGPSASGKSTIQEAIQAVFGGPPTVSSRTPQQLADTRFNAAALFEAMLNTVNDINSTKVEDTGTLKRVWAGERTPMENKHKDSFDAAPNTKHLYTANWLPRMTGQDEAIYRRVLIIEFMNTIDEEDVDRTVKKEMQSESTRQVILNRALAARERLHEQDGFTNDRSREDTRKKWDSWRDGHKRYLYTQFDVTGDSDQTVGKDAYYQAFKEFVGRTGYAMKSKVAITKSLQWVPEVQVNDDTYGGLEWREEDAAEDESDDENDDDVDLTAVQAAESVVKNAGKIWFAELRATLGHRHDLAPDMAENAIDRAVEKGKIIEDDGGQYRPV